MRNNFLNIRFWEGKKISWLFFLFFSFLLGCSSEETLIKNSNNSIVMQLLLEAEEKRYNRKDFNNFTIKLEELTPFKWSKVFYFHKGIKYQEINKRLSYLLLKRDNEKNSVITKRGLLVFTNKSKVVHAVIPDDHTVDIDFKSSYVSKGNVSVEVIPSATYKYNFLEILRK